jgi:hypothetical protein
MQLLGREALQHFEQMGEELYSQMIWLLFVFYQLCGHAGLVDEGMLLCFNYHSLYGFCKTGTSHCMFELLGCAGHLQEAENIIKAMSH